MNPKVSQNLLDYCCIMLYDHASFNPHPTDNDSLVELFIRNSLKVKSTKQVRMYFENHLVGKSAIYNFPTKNVRKCVSIYNKLKKENIAYNGLIPISKVEASDIKDMRYLQYKILAFEVENNINGIKSFDDFLLRGLVFQSPAQPDHICHARIRTSKPKAIRTPITKIRTNLPKVQSS